VGIEDRQLLVKSMLDDTMSQHGQLRVDVHGPRCGHEEELRLEEVEIVDRKGRQPLTRHGEDPLRQESRVEREQPRWVGERGLDVAAFVTDDEGVAVEDLDLFAVHRDQLLPTRAPARAAREMLDASSRSTSPSAPGRRATLPPLHLPHRWPSCRTLPCPS
jgi:hypothetical protein